MSNDRTAASEGAETAAGKGAAPGAMRRNLRWFIIAVPLFLAWAVANTDKLGIGVIASDRTFLVHFGIENNHAAVGLLLTAFAVPYAICNFLWGMVIDRIGARAVMMISATLWAAMMILAGVAGSYELLLLSRVILGIGEGALWAASNKLVGNWFHTRERARAQGFYTYGQVAGPAVGSSLIVAVMTGWGWQASFWILGALSLLIILPLFYLIVRDTPEQSRRLSDGERAHIASGRRVLDEAVAVGPESGSVRQVFRRFPFWLTTLAFMATSVSFYGLAAWIPTYLIQVRGFSAVVMGAWLSIAYLIAIAATILGTFIADWLHRPALLGAIGFLISGLALLVGITSSSAEIAAPMVALGQGGSLMSTAMSMTVLQRYFAPAVMGRASGTMTAIGNIVGGTSATWLGWIIDANHGDYVASFLSIVLFLLAGAISFAVLARDDTARQVPTPVAA
jgi:ACS family glucarate transporter-like MFS transporter